MTILPLGMESFGSVGMALSHAPACFSMEESTILICWVQAVVKLLEGLTCNLFSKGVLGLETWVTIQRMCILESADFTTHLSWRRCHVVEWGTCLDPKGVEEPCSFEEALAWNPGKANLSR